MVTINNIMAKKKPTHRNIRQGQTVYFINRHLERAFDAKPEIDSYFLYSHKQRWPPRCCIIERMPVSLLKELIKNNPHHGFYFSRRKAVRKMRDL